MATRLIPIIACVLACLAGINTAHAQSSAVMTDGSVAVGYDSRACNATTQGAVRFNSATDYLAFCNGNINQWVGPICGLGCSPPAGCNAPGLACADGSIFVGFIIFAGSSCQAIYATSTNQTSGNWRNGTGADAGASSMIDGRANQNWIIANRTITNYPAFNTCENLTDHGRTDWYLPSRDELQLLYKSLSIGSAQNYWTSTEYTATSNAWMKRLDTGNVSQSAKNIGRLVRCVRRN